MFIAIVSLYGIVGVLALTVYAVYKLEIAHELLKLKIDILKLKYKIEKNPNRKIKIMRKLAKQNNRVTHSNLYKVKEEVTGTDVVFKMVDKRGNTYHKIAIKTMANTQDKKEKDIQS